MTAVTFAVSLLCGLCFELDYVIFFGVTYSVLFLAIMVEPIYRDRIRLNCRRIERLFVTQSITVAGLAVAIILAAIGLVYGMYF